METIAQEAKRLLEPIPETEWTTDTYIDDMGCKCMMGHWYSKKGFNDPGDNPEASREIRKSIREYLKEKTKTDKYIAFDVNDGLCHDYSQPTPKQRTMALLDDMIAAGY